MCSSEWVQFDGAAFDHRRWWLRRTLCGSCLTRCCGSRDADYKRNYHLFRSMLYQVATGLLSADEISGPLRSILSRQENIDVLLDEVTGISPKQRIVHLKHR